MFNYLLITSVYIIVILLVVVAIIITYIYVYMYIMHSHHMGTNQQSQAIPSWRVFIFGGSADRHGEGRSMGRYVAWP